MPFCNACRVMYTCKDIRTTNLKLHNFPRRDWQRNFLVSWLSFCGMPLTAKDFERNFVCSKHFSKEDYFPGANRKLRYDAVPHLCPPVELVKDGDPMKNIATKPPEKKNVYDLGRREMLENVKKQLCRICGKREGLLEPIFEESSDGTTLETSIATKIKLYLPVKLEDTTLPLNICTKCSGLLEQFHEMNITCVAVDRILRKTFGVDESDVLFQTHDEREEEVELQRESYKNHHRETVAQVLREQIDNMIRLESEAEEEANVFVESSKKSSTVCTQFVCGYCGENFQFFKHRANHTIVCRELPGVCEICGKQFPRKDLRKHLKQCCSNQRMYMCDKCGKIFRSKQALDYHFKTKHETTSDIKHYCEVCCKTFSTKMSYQGHLKCHKPGNMSVIFSIGSDKDEEVGVYKCPLCDSLFGDKVSLIVHLNAPNEIKCVICLSKFHCEKSFLVHLYSPKWKCQFCEKVFCYKYTAVAHERVHTGDKPFKCMMCDMRFRTVSHKSKHQMVHHAFKHQCIYCDKKFRYKSIYKDHVGKHLGRVISCDTCGKHFGSKFSLWNHNRRFHQKIVNFEQSQNFDLENEEDVPIFSLL